MAIQQIQKSSVLKPDMIDDIIEVVVYDQKDGSLHTAVGVLSAYSVSPQGTTIKFAGVETPQSVPNEGFTITITHYEYVLDMSDAEDDK